MFFMSLPRFERWRRSRRPGNTRRKSKRKQGGRCTSYQIHWNQTSLLICGRNNIWMDLILSKTQNQNSLPPMKGKGILFYNSNCSANFVLVIYLNLEVCFSILIVSLSWILEFRYDFTRSKGISHISDIMFPGLVPKEKAYKFSLEDYTIFF